MTTLPITTERVFELIETYGAEPGAWPEEEREAATTLVASEPETFAAALDEARALDALLMSETVPEPSAALTDAILSAAPAAARQRKSLLGHLGAMVFPQGARWPAGAALASLMMGLVGGYAYASTGAGYDQVEDAYYAAFGYDTNDAWTSLE
ncbi:MAG: hypothetical protein AAGL11_11060 [Pseudomonadota bacterium]